MFNRRTFLSAAACAGLSIGTSARASWLASEKRVLSEVGPLRRVVVHAPGPETWKAFPQLLGSHSMLTWELLRGPVVEQHQQMVTALEEAGAEVLRFDQLLADAIEQARRDGVFGEWLRNHAPRLAGYEQEVTAAVLVGCEDRFVYRTDKSGLFRPLTDPMTTLFFTRDCAAVTPRGVVICNYNNRLRAFESTLARFVFLHAPGLRGYEIAFDAAQEDVFIQGGDLLVVDADTLMIGVGNTTSDAAAIRLAKKLEMDVLAVEMPSGQWRPGGWDGLREIFYHLDCLLNFVDHRKVLAVPYLLETKHAIDNPILDLLEGFGRIDALPPRELSQRLADVRNVGWVRRYKAGSGKRDFSLPRFKIVDYLKDAGYQIIPVGGELAEDGNALRHVTEQVVRECRFMAVNVVATSPGKIVAYDGNRHTREALTQAGVEVRTFPASELVRANGGPHCLTLPLERG